MAAKLFAQAGHAIHVRSGATFSFPTVSGSTLFTCHAPTVWLTASTELTRVSRAILVVLNSALLRDIGLPSEL